MAIRGHLEGLEAEKKYRFKRQVILQQLKEMVKEQRAPTHAESYGKYLNQYYHYSLVSDIIRLRAAAKDPSTTRVTFGMHSDGNPYGKGPASQHAQFLQNSIKYLMNPKFEQFMNFDSRLCKNLNLKETDNFILMYKTHFIRDPPHVAWILYAVDYEKFMVLIYNQAGQSVSKIDISIEFAERFLPFVRVGLMNHEFLILGRRIFLALKTSLIIEYQSMKSWKEVCGRVGDFGEALDAGLGLRRPAEAEHLRGLKKRAELLKMKKLHSAGLVSQDMKSADQAEVRQSAFNARKANNPPAQSPAVPIQRFVARNRNRIGLHG